MTYSAGCVPATTGHGVRSDRATKDRSRATHKESGAGVPQPFRERIEFLLPPTADADLGRRREA